MAEAQAEPEERPKKKSRKPFLAGVVLMALLGGGGFFAAYTGRLPFLHREPAAEAHAEPEALPDIAFVPLSPLVVSLGPESGNRFLHFTAEIEVEKPHESEVTLLIPRILDVLNGYLRAVDAAQLEDATALVKLRAQMLRRVQLVCGKRRVRDLLVTEFVIN